MMEMINVVLEGVTKLVATSSKEFLSFLSLVVIGLFAIAWHFFHSSTVAVRVGVFFLLILFLAIVGAFVYSHYGSQTQMSEGLGQSESSTFQKPKSYDKTIVSITTPKARAGTQCNDNNPPLECLWIK